MEEQIAILIDGDNISPKYAEYIKMEAMRIGRIKICRLYGSISSPTVKSWYNVMPSQGITPMLQISYAGGKSIADQALTIDAMDLLYTGDIDIICLVTSDSDFTKLAYRIKEFGKKVIGMGERKTNESLAKACDEFKLLDLIYGKSNQQNEHGMKNVLAETEEVEENTEAAPICIPTDEVILKDILDMLDEDWENLANIGIYISKKRPGFDVRILGYRNISEFIRKHDKYLDLKFVKAEDEIHKVVYVKRKEE